MRAAASSWLSWPPSTRAPGVQFLDSSGAFLFLELLIDARLLHDRDAAAGRVENLRGDACGFLSSQPCANGRNVLRATGFHIRFFDGFHLDFRALEIVIRVSAGQVVLLVQPYLASSRAITLPNRQCRPCMRDWPAGKITEQSRNAGEVNDAATGAVFGAYVVGKRPGAAVVAFQMHRQNRIPVGLFHFENSFIPENSGVC